MEFDELIESIESAPQKNDWYTNVNLLTLQTLDQQFVDLLAPIIGVDFVAGLDAEHADWLCYSNHYIAKLKPGTSDDSELPLLRKQNLCLTEFIKTLELPMRVTAKYLNQSDIAFNLFDTDHQFLIAEDRQLIPAQAIYQLRMLGTNSWQ